MISQCANPECRKPLMYLREGRLGAIQHKNGHEFVVEYFWLCGKCASHLRFEPTVDGIMHVVPAPPETMQAAVDPS